MVEQVVFGALGAFAYQVGIEVGAGGVVSVVKLILKNCADGVVGFTRGLGESEGRVKIKNRTVSEFWGVGRAKVLAKGVERSDQPEWPYVLAGYKERIGVKIELGLLIPYAPLTPAHPLCRPGLSPQGWDLVDNSRGLQVGGAADYDVLDSLIYADRVVRLAPHRKTGYYYAGLYDYYYGQSIVCLPLLIHRDVLRKTPEALEMWTVGSSPSGLAVTLTGNLLQVETKYSTSLEFIPEEYRGLPTYGLEVTEIKVLSASAGVTHITTPINWLYRGRDKELAAYFNVQDPGQFRFAQKSLSSARTKRRVVFDYDDASLWQRGGPGIPEYNEMLRAWFEDAM